MLAALLLWSLCYRRVMTAEKFIFLFGRVAPSLSLLFSVAMAFVPRFAARMGEVARARRGLCGGESKGTLADRAKEGLKVLSATVTWALEGAIITADSMKSRGYGLPGRTAFALYRFDRRDGALLALVLGLSAYVAVGMSAGIMRFVWFPAVKGNTLSLYGGSVYGAYLALCLLPAVLEGRERRLWKRLQSKI